MCFRILKGFKLIAVGERLRRPRRIGKKILILEGSNSAQKCDPFRVKVFFLSRIRGRRATLAHGY